MTIKLPTGYKLAEFESLESTNKHALKLAQMGEQGAIIVFTKNQTQGRGRSGRTWLSSAQTLTTSILIHSQAPKDKLAQLSFVMAVAAHKTICDFTKPKHHKNIGLKWPNDILHQGHKLAGILIESQNNAQAIGIGINISAIPQNQNFSATSLTQLGANTTPESVLSPLVQNFATFFDLWAEGKNFLAIRKIWLNNAIGLGGKITARLPNKTHHGIFEKLDENGTLILRDEAGKIHQITAGDIFVGYI